MSEFLYIKSKNEEILLQDDVDILDHACLNALNEEYLISNKPTKHAKIFAPEINFYIQNSTLSVLEKAKNVSDIYEINALKFDLNQSKTLMQEVGKNILIISDENLNQLKIKLQNQELKSVQISPKQLQFIHGHLGKFSVYLKEENQEIELEASCIIYPNAPLKFHEKKGIITSQNHEEILQILGEFVGNYSFFDVLNYDKSICQYHQRRIECCTKCVDICPCEAIFKIDSQKELKFHAIDCQNCGDCVGVCPSGALDYAPLNQNTLKEIMPFFAGKIPLILDESFDFEAKISLSKDFMPLFLEASGMLNQANLMSFLQESGSQIVLYSSEISQALAECINLLNALYQKAFKKKGILLAQNEAEFKQALNEADFIPKSQYHMSENNLLKREIFSKRASFVVGDLDLGKFETGEFIRYGHVDIDENICTLCLSCVGACNIKALSIDKVNHALLFNPSLCTTCGYCLVNCAEKDCISLRRDGLEFKKESFEYQIKAKDTLFECIKCKKPIGTSKTIQKIANLMRPKFGNDHKKIATLYCCADCKVKVMLEEITNHEELLKV